MPLLAVVAVFGGTVKKKLPPAAIDQYSKFDKSIQFAKTNPNQMLARHLSFIFAVGLLTLCGCAARLAPIAMDKAKWSEQIKTEGISLRFYLNDYFQVGNIGGYFGPGLIQALIGETKAPAIRPKTTVLLADDLVREIDLAGISPFDREAPPFMPWEAFEKPLARMDGERRFILKVGVRSEILNHLPTAWKTNQYWLSASAALIDTSDGKSIWQGSCLITLDPDDKSRQVTNEQLGSDQGEFLLASVVKAATRQCAAAMNKTGASTTAG